MKRIAIIGAGISGLAAAWQLAQLQIPFTLFEAGTRLGGTIETIHRDGFTIELGPDGWISEKPWARDLAIELGLEDQLIYSNDATRVTYILRDRVLVPIPDGMRLMVPTDLTAIEHSPLFSLEAKRAYALEPQRAAELRATAPQADESIASFVVRHFGQEVLRTIAAPLLSGVFGGDVETLSVRAVMPQFVAMEHTHGSLILALQSRQRTAQTPPIFTTLRSGLSTLTDCLEEQIPQHAIRTNQRVTSVKAAHGQVEITIGNSVNLPAFDHVLLAVPAHTAISLMRGTLPHIAALLPTEESSAIVVAYAFTQSFDLPKGFGFLAPSSDPKALLAGTFTDQKFTDRVPAGGRLLRAFFGGYTDFTRDPRPNVQLVREAFTDMEKILGPLPAPAHTIVRRWPHSLPQYAVGHVPRIAELNSVLQGLPGLHLLGNAYRGVGLPDLIRDARATARIIATT